MTFCRAACLLSVLLLAPAVLTGQILIEELHTEGNHRLKEPAILAASGLRIKTKVARTDLDAALQRLSDTGLFTSLNYRYAPRGATGHSVTLIVAEEATPVAVVLDLSGIEPERLWAQLLGSTLVDRVVPAQPAAVEFYVREIESALEKTGRHERLTSRPEADLQTGRTTEVIQTFHRPRIADIAFEGNAVLTTKAIRDRILKLTEGNPFSERDFRNILEANIRPMFEEKGLLQMAFRSVRTASAVDGKVAVTTTIEDGPVWRLGKVTLEGNELPRDRMLAAGKFGSGHVANWTELLSGVANMTTVLSHEGYILAAAKPVRSFQSETGMVDVTVNVDKGKLYRFGSVEVTGLTEPDRQKALSLWKLQPGQPMDGPYVDEFAKEVFRVVRPPAKGVGPGYGIRPGTDQVDVKVTFK